MENGLFERNIRYLYHKNTSNFAFGKNDLISDSHTKRRTNYFTILMSFIWLHLITLLLKIIQHTGCYCYLFFFFLSSCYWILFIWYFNRCCHRLSIHMHTKRAEHHPSRVSINFHTNKRVYVMYTQIELIVCDIIGIEIKYSFIDKTTFACACIFFFKKKKKKKKTRKGRTNSSEYFAKCKSLSISNYRHSNGQQIEFCVCVSVDMCHKQNLNITGSIAFQKWIGLFWDEVV